MAIEQLRIVAECAAGHRARPGNGPCLARLEEAIRYAGRYHSVNEIAETAKMHPTNVDAILQPAAEPALEESRPHGFARTVGAFRNSPA
jgi:hypothetical protein